MTNRRVFLLGACAAVLPLPLLAQSNAPMVTGSGTTMPQTNVIDALAGASSFNSFIELARVAGAVELLRGAGPFTLFAPNDSAMNSLPNSLREMLNPTGGGNPNNRQDPDMLRLMAFVNMHIVEGRYTRDDFAGRTLTLRTRNGNMLEIETQPGMQPTAKIVGDNGFGAGGVNVMFRPTVLELPQIICSNGVVMPISVPMIQ
ncbi:MAG: beta-Ig-H3/fasciclin [Rubritepida sp.]|nr:beta-Ig-H3/fasciclin [Rubritepida sp.]